MSFSSVQLLIFSLFSVFASLGFLLYWHCAYKKSGTKLLMLPIIFLPLSFLIGLPSSIIGLSKTDEFSLLLALFLFLTSLIEAWWWVACLRLRSLNKAKKAMLKAHV